MEGLALEVNKFLHSNKRRQSEETTEGRLVRLLIEQIKHFIFHFLHFLSEIRSKIISWEWGGREGWEKENM